MKAKRLVVTIDKPAQAVFDFTLDPANTPKWVPSIVDEQTNHWPPKVGTAYRNQNAAGDWTKYRLTQLDPPKMFVMSDVASPRHMRYTITSLGANKCELEYFEWMEQGDLGEPATQELLELLKKVVEEKS